MFLSLLTNKYVIIGIILCLIGVYIVVLKSNISVLKAENTKLITELQVSQASVKSLQIAINDQNVAIQKMKTDSDERIAAGKVLIEKAKLESNKHRLRAEDLMKVIPNPALTRCDAATELINQEIINAK